MGKTAGAYRQKNNATLNIFFFLSFLSSSSSSSSGREIAERERINL